MSPTWRDSVLPVDKPEGPTSHDVVKSARRALGTRKIGHTGTLDPFASGLLLLCVGRATRLAEYLSGLEKTYEATARLGQSTDTDDSEGVVVAESALWEELTDTQVHQALESFLGVYAQIPPQFSAKKVGGERMHRRARRGERVALEPCEVTIYSIESMSLDLPLVRFHVRCSSGTYIRALARDLGDRIGVGGHLVGLRRTAIGSFHVSEAIELEDLDEDERVARAAVDPLRALAHLVRVDVAAESAERIGHGQSVQVPGVPGDGLVALAFDDALLAVADVRDGVAHPRKVWAV